MCTVSNPFTLTYMLTLEVLLDHRQHFYRADDLIEYIEKNTLPDREVYNDTLTLTLALTRTRTLTLTPLSLIVRFIQMPLRN